MIIRTAFPIPKELKESYDGYKLSPLYYTNLFRVGFDDEKATILARFITWLKLKMGKKGFKRHDNAN